MSSGGVPLAYQKRREGPGLGSPLFARKSGVQQLRNLGTDQDTWLRKTHDGSVGFCVSDSFPTFKDNVTTPGLEPRSPRGTEADLLPRVTCLHL